MYATYAKIGDLLWLPEQAYTELARLNQWNHDQYRAARALQHRRTRLLAELAGIEVRDDFDGRLFPTETPESTQHCPLCEGYLVQDRRLDSGDWTTETLIGCRYCDLWW